MGFVQVHRDCGCGWRRHFLCASLCSCLQVFGGGALWGARWAVSFLEPSRTVVVSWVLYNCWIGTWLRDFEVLRSVAGMTFPQADVVETGGRGYVLG